MDVVDKHFIESVYIASPYSDGNRLINVMTSLQYAEDLVEWGLIPFTPLLYHYWDELHEHDWEFWLNQCLYWVGKCDAVLRLPGESKGADIEVEYAQHRGIPVFYDVGDLLDAAL